MKKVLFMLLVMFALSACQSKDSYVKEFSDFVDKVEMEAADYTDKDWKKADLKFSDLSTDLYAKFEEELNADEKAEIASDIRWIENESGRERRCQKSG
jgi:hypothetical protein